MRPYDISERERERQSRTERERARDAIRFAYNNKNNIFCLLCKRKTFNYFSYLVFSSLFFLRSLLERIHCPWCLNPIEDALPLPQHVVNFRPWVLSAWMNVIRSICSLYGFFFFFCSRLFATLFSWRDTLSKARSSRAYRIHILFAFLQFD